MNHPHAYHASKGRLPPKDQLIMGLHALTELFAAAPDRILKVYTSVKNAQERKTGILKECEKWQVPVVLTNESELTHMCGSDSHQMFAAHVKGRTFLDVAQFLEKIGDKDRSVVLMCDQIFDPQNFGALIRSAECLGADAVVWSKNRGSDLTPVAAKSSCGASEWMTLVRIANLAEGVSQFQKGGYEVVASVLKEGAVDAFRFSFSPRTVIVVGSEGEGIQPLIQKRADHCLYIPMSGKIQSLNVAQAATSLLTCFQRASYFGAS